MASGVQMDKIVPRLAQQECERAIAKFPNTPRFKFQLGRAQETGQDYSSANASYLQAAAAGYAAAFYNLGVNYGYGHGVPKDNDVAQKLLQKAEAGGVNAAQNAFRLFVFLSDGYSSPQVFQALYDGRLSVASIRSQAVYWFTFLDRFHDTPDCSRVMTDQTYAKFYMAAQTGMVAGMFSALAGANRNYRPGDFGAAAQSGLDAGMGFDNRVIAKLSNAKEDAQLFCERHGCDSPVAYQFFNNLAALANQL